MLRPLRAISSIKGLQILVISVMNSFGLLGDTILVLFSFFTIFSIACTQLMSGYLKKRCVNIETGQRLPGDDIYFCGGVNTCPEGYFCGKQNENPNFGVTNFDNVCYAMLIVFQCITMEGWSDIMIMYQQAYTNYVFIIFIPMVFVGAFFLVNLLLAVINTSFSNTHKVLQAKNAAEKARRRKKKKVVVDEDNFDEAAAAD